MVERSNIFVGVILGLVVLIIAHHALTHDGLFFEEQDFQNGFTDLFKSHEAIMVLLIVFFFGALAGKFIFEKKKRS